MNYNVGDIVKANCPVGKANISGAIGRVIQCDSMILVEFINDIAGHDGGNGEGKNGHCWYCDADNLEPYDDSPPLEACVTFAAPVNDYSRACWYCREGGAVDALAAAAGLLVVCPCCGRIADGRKVL